MKFKRVMSLLLAVVMVLGMMPSFAVSAADETPFVVLSDVSGGQSRYLTTVGSNAFNVFMYNNTFSGTFGDQHMAGIELSLHGYRIATNGDIHLLPTPEQWDATPAPTVDSEGGWPPVTKKVFDEEKNTITVPMSFRANAESAVLTYNLVASPTADGVRIQVVLTSDMPEDLVGKARFNLEFIPSKYQNKTFQADTDGDGKYDDFGIFPLHPQDPMEETERAELDQEWYVEDWNEDRGNAQPLPFAEAEAFSFAPEDEYYHVTVESGTGTMELFDGRNRAQNGWYVLSGLIGSGKTGDVVTDWIIRPDTKEGWVREPNIGFSQAGYSPAQDKVAVIELDKYDNSYPRTASLYQVQADGTRVKVHEGSVSGDPTAWQRYKYVRYDFSAYQKAGLYEIHYGDQVTEVFPIGKDVYDNSWQTALSGFMAVQMDHIEVREGYKIWHGAPHMDDGWIGPKVNSYFDGMGMPQELPKAITDRGYTWESYVEGLNVGGWFDAGDFDIQTARNVEVLEDLIYAAEAFDNMYDYDTLTVKWDDATGGVVEMHRPDGIPDILQQIAHGSKQILAQYEKLGGVGGTHEVRSLRQYTHLGDPSTDTDGYIYDKNLKEDQIVSRNGKLYSGKADDRYFLLSGGGGTFTSNLLGNNSANFAGAAYLLMDVYPELAERCMKAAMEIWDREHNKDTPDFSKEWNTLVQMMLVTKAMEAEDCDFTYPGSGNYGEYDYEYFKARLSTLAAENVKASNIAGGWRSPSCYNLVFVMDELSEDLQAQFAAAVNEHAGSLDDQYGDLPYGVMWTSGSGWGGSPTIIALGQRVGILHQYFPENEILEKYTLNAVDYILGCHPQTNASWVSGVGTKSTLQPYNSNRGDESFIPGSILPGHITFAPDYVESLDDFSFLWFEGESIVNYQSQWISAAMAASLIANDEAKPTQAATKDFSSSCDVKLTKVGENDGYLEDENFNMFMYSTTFDRTFGDQHCAGIELIQSGRRVATNGDIHLLPTPEQWDATPAPVRDNRTFDEATNTVTVDMTLPEEKATGNPEVKYHLIAEPEAGGVKLTVKLDEKLPADLQGKAGFNLEFMPAVFIGKSFQADSDGDGQYDDYGVFPLVPGDDMKEMTRARTGDQLWYVKDWNEDRGDAQPLPFAVGEKMTFASEDDDYRIRIECDDGLSLYDGRNRAQNGWFVLRTVIPRDATEIVWHISPDVQDNWVREPSIAHNQAGYEPDLSKVAVIELDANAAGPDEATLKRLDEDGYKTVYTGSLGEAKTWQRYQYRNFDFSSVKEPGLYVISYGGTTTDPFPIAKGVYDSTWQQSLSNYLAVQMDHIRVREGYKIWHAASHMDDALQAPANTQWFDGWSMGEKNTKFNAYEHIPGLNVGGWFDAGDFDIQTSRNMQVIQDLALAWQEYDVDYDTMTVEWDMNTNDGATGGSVELHRPDSIPDIQQQIKHGTLQILAQLKSVGFVFPVIEVPSLRQYTHLGDGSKDTDNRVKVGKDSDDRMALAGTKNTRLQLNAAATLAAASNSLQGYDNKLAKTCLDTAIEVWNEEHPQENPYTGTDDWNTAIELFLVTGDEVYKERIEELFDSQMATSSSGWRGPAFASNGWKVVRVLDKMDESYTTKFQKALWDYLLYLDDSVAGNPFGVPDTNGMWGGSTGVVDMGVRMSILHKYFPKIVSRDYTFRVMDYILGTHPYNDTSWLSGVGTKSVEIAYGSNRADNYYIAGGIVPGYVTIQPNFPEALDDFGFLWFESEYVIDTAAKWIVLANGAAQFATEDPVELDPRPDPDPTPSGGGSSTSKYTISVKQAEGGTISPATSQVNKGDSMIFTITPNAGYRIADVLVDGKSVGAVGTYTFKNVTASHTITAKFEEGEATTFADVRSDAYYADAVAWAVGKGITTGTSATTFSPNAECTRAQAVTFLWRAAGSPTPSSSDMPFTDVAADSYYYNAVLWAVEKGVTKGTSDTLFSPNMQCSRGQIVTFLWRANDAKASSAENPFADVPADAYYKDAVLWAVENNVTKGTSDTTFEPVANCTRGQIVTFLYRYMG